MDVSLLAFLVHPSRHSRVGTENAEARRPWGGLIKFCCEVSVELDSSQIDGIESYLLSNRHWQFDHVAYAP